MEEITFITSDVKLMVTITDSTGVSQTIQMEFLTLKEGFYKKNLEKKILKELNKNPFNKTRIIKVKIH